MGASAGTGQARRHTLEVRKVRLLVERSGLETERVDDVVDLDDGVIKILLGLLSGSVGTGICKSGWTG